MAVFPSVFRTRGAAAAAAAADTMSVSAMSNGGGAGGGGAHAQSMLGVHGWIHLVMVVATALLLKKYVEIHGLHTTTTTQTSEFCSESWVGPAK